ncbi:MAG TPA: CopG family transcriptional regulator [Sediminispirochaeta sp.]|nr:CopG family transcriptional regulator [Sediminispirochaeta sp.]
MRKQEIISFKADQRLVEALNKIPNRSEFIRAAVLRAMDNICPLCQGTGILTPSQQEHWHEFEHHSIVTCQECKETYISCDHESG